LGESETIEEISMVEQFQLIYIGFVRHAVYLITIGPSDILEIKVLPRAKGPRFFLINRPFRPPGSSKNPLNSKW